MAKLIFVSYFALKVRSRILEATKSIDVCFDNGCRNSKKKIERKEKDNCPYKILKKSPVQIP